VPEVAEQVEENRLALITTGGIRLVFASAPVSTP